MYFRNQSEAEYLVITKIDEEFSHLFIYLLYILQIFFLFVDDERRLMHVQRFTSVTVEVKQITLLRRLEHQSCLSSRSFKMLFLRKLLSALQIEMSGKIFQLICELIIFWMWITLMQIKKKYWSFGLNFPSFQSIFEHVCIRK